MKKIDQRINAARESKSFLEFIWKIGLIYFIYLYFFRYDQAKKILSDVERNISIERTLELSGQISELEKANEVLIGRLNKYEGDGNKNVLHVLDTCIIKAKNFDAIIEKIESYHEKIVITSVVRRELNNIQFLDCVSQRNARKLLARAAENDRQYLSVDIDDKKMPSGDEEILKYMLNQSLQYNVILYSCDKNFVLQARENDIKAVYYSSAVVNSENKSFEITDVKKLIQDHIHLSSGKIEISNLSGKNYLIKVVAKDGFQYSTYDIKLTKGDNILVLKKQSKQQFHFAHFIVKSYDLKGCCELIFEKTLTDLETKFTFDDEGSQKFLEYRKMYNDFLRVYRRVH